MKNVNALENIRLREEDKRNYLQLGLMIVGSVLYIKVT